MGFARASWPPAKWRSSMCGKTLVTRMVLAALALGGGAAPTSAQSPKPSDSYDELFDKYLKEAHAATSAAPEIQAWSWMNALALDRCARYVNDLLTIRVVENITG